MKAKVVSASGKEKEAIELPRIFSSKIREDIAQRYFEISKKMQPYGPSPVAGKMYSASGKLKHRRHKWKTTYGKGISRVPRKIFWRRGTQFYWQGATVSGTVGGRRAHPPKIKHFLKEKKINKKEMRVAFGSAIASTTSIDFLKTRYSKLKEKEIGINLPIIVESKILELGSKEFLTSLRKILDNLYATAIQIKAIRAGKGKGRGRKYKKSAGLLFVVGNKEEKKIGGIDIVGVDQITIQDLWPLGRLTIYTKQAIQEIGKIEKKEKTKERRKKRQDKRKERNLKRKQMEAKKRKKSAVDDDKKEEKKLKKKIEEKTK